MFTHKHYVPILKTKAGERWALGRVLAHTRRQFTPLLEIHQHKKKADGDHVDEICEDLATFLGASDKFFLDTKWLHDPTGNPAIITSTFQSSRAQGLSAIPVAQVTYSAQSITSLQAVIAADARGYMLRIGRDSLLNPAAITAFVAAVGQPLANVDLMIDCQTALPQLAVDMPHVPSVNDWRTITVASGVFPNTYAGMGLGVWHQLPRDDYQAWRTGVVGGALPRKPAFADYTVRDPGAPAEFGEPSVNLRYTCQDYWLMRIGGKVKSGLSSDIFAICQSLIARPEYSGPTFSAGDAEIHLVASGLSGPGNPQQWVQWCVNHHIEFVARQIANDSAI